MTTESPNLAQSPIPVTENNSLDVGSYYRSRVVTAHSGVNTLVSLAQPLLIFLARIYSSQTAPNLAQLQENIQHELKTFESRCQAQAIDKDSIVIARYLICIAIEESHRNAVWNDHSDSAYIAKLFPDLDNLDTFFTLIEQICREPEKHIELIELAYLCLSLGFKESYQHQEKGELQLDNILDHLYRTIRSKRGDSDSHLLLTPKAKKTKQRRTGIPLWLYSLIATLLLVVFYAGFSYMLKVNITLFPIELHHSQQNKNILSNEDL